MGMCTCVVCFGRFFYVLVMLYTCIYIGGILVEYSTSTLKLEMLDLRYVRQFEFIYTLIHISI